MPCVSASRRRRAGVEVGRRRRRVRRPAARAACGGSPGPAAGRPRRRPRRARFRSRAPATNVKSSPRNRLKRSRYSRAVLADDEARARRGHSGKHAPTTLVNGAVSARTTRCPRHSRTRSRTIARPRPLSRASIVSSVSGAGAESPSARLTSWRPGDVARAIDAHDDAPVVLAGDRGLRVAQQVHEDRGQRVVLDREIRRPDRRATARAPSSRRPPAAPPPRPTRSRPTASRRRGACAVRAAASAASASACGTAQALVDRRELVGVRPRRAARAAPRRGRDRACSAPNTGSRASAPQRDAVAAAPPASGGRRSSATTADVGRGSVIVADNLVARGARRRRAARARWRGA